MISNSDFEKIWFLYKTEGEPKGVSINAFCINRGVNYNEFNKWFRKMHKAIVPLEIENAPASESNVTSEKSDEESGQEFSTKKGGIYVFIRTRDGIQIQKKGLKNMTEEELRRDNRFLIEQLMEVQKENRQLKEEISEIRNEVKAANRRADEEAAGRKRLFDKFERFMDEQKSAADEVDKLKRKLETAENRLALANAALYNGSKTCSDKDSERRGLLPG